MNAANVMNRTLNLNTACISNSLVSPFKSISIGTTQPFPTMDAGERLISCRPKSSKILKSPIVPSVEVTSIENASRMTTEPIVLGQPASFEKTLPQLESVANLATIPKCSSNSNIFKEPQRLVNAMAANSKSPTASSIVSDSVCDTSFVSESGSQASY